MIFARAEGRQAGLWYDEEVQGWDSGEPRGVRGEDPRGVEVTGDGVAAVGVGVGLEYG